MAICKRPGDSEIPKRWDGSNVPRPSQKNSGWNYWMGGLIMETLRFEGKNSWKKGIVSLEPLGDTFLRRKPKVRLSQKGLNDKLKRWMVVQEFGINSWRFVESPWRRCKNNSQCGSASLGIRTRKVGDCWIEQRSAHTHTYIQLRHLKVWSGHPYIFLVIHIHCGSFGSSTPWGCCWIISSWGFRWAGSWVVKMVQSHQIVIFLVFQHRHTRLSNKWHSDMVKCVSNTRPTSVNDSGSVLIDPVLFEKNMHPDFFSQNALSSSRAMLWLPILLHQVAVLSARRTTQAGGRLQTLCPCHGMIPSPRVKDKIYQTINVKIRQNWFSPTWTHKKPSEFHLLGPCSFPKFLSGWIFFRTSQADILEADQACTVAAGISTTEKTSMSTLDLLTVL